MPKFEVTSDRLAGHCRGDMAELDPEIVNIPALIEAGHIKPARSAPGGRGNGGNARTR